MTNKNDFRHWMRLIETNAPFLDHIQDAVDASEAGFHYEEGGCWGMALALYDAFKASGDRPQLVVTSDEGHAMVQVDGRLYDYTGDVTDSYSDVQPTTRTGLMRMAIKTGSSAWDVRGDAIAAAEIIQTAKHWNDETK